MNERFTVAFTPRTSPDVAEAKRWWRRPEGHRCGSLAQELLQRAGLPASAHEDALHIAVSATGMDYLLTWNCKHIANGMIIPRVNAVVRGFGFEPPLIYTPQQLMEG